MRLPAALIPGKLVPMTFHPFDATIGPRAAGIVALAFGAVLVSASAVLGREARALPTLAPLHAALVPKVQ